VFDNFSAIEEVNGEVINVILWDTAGQDDYAQVRTTCYNNAKYDVFLLCFSVIHRDSFDNIKYKWLPELKQNSPGTPFILVGTKVDLREETNATHIGQKEGAKRAKEVKAHTYVECTSRDPQSVGKVVMEAVSIVLEADKARRLKNEKQYKTEKKQEEKDAKKELKKKKKEEAGQSSNGSSSTTTTTSTSTSKGKQKEESSPWELFFLVYGASFFTHAGAAVVNVLWIVTILRGKKFAISCVN